MARHYQDDPDAGDPMDEEYYASLGDARFEERLRRAPTIGAFVGQLLREQRLSYAEVAKAAGLNKSSVYRIVEEARGLERDTLIVLLSICGLPVHQINRALVFAGYAPLHHLRRARGPEGDQVSPPPPVREGRDDKPDDGAPDDDAGEAGTPTRRR